MEHELSLNEMQNAWHGSARAYAIGFITSLCLTSLSFLLVVAQALPDRVLLTTIGGLALFQAAIQLFYFLHLGKEGKPHWETGIFLFVFIILLIIVGGSLWIMYDLNERTMRGAMEMTHD